MSVKYIYIAGPYTRPNPNHNTKRAIEMADTLLRYGYHPYLPHLTHFWDTVSPKPYEEWLKIDLAWIDRCDAVLRIPGDSSGADKEIAYAIKLGLPIYYDLESLLSAK